MPKLISVIIPYYDESESVLQYAVHSVAMQCGVNLQLIEVLLVNDGNPQCAVSDAFCERWPGLYVRKVQQKRNAGPGVTRQTGIDVACGDYVMFIDADDRLYSTTVLGAFAEMMMQQHPDIIRSPWLEEVLREDLSSKGFSYVEHPPDATWMFSKAYRKGFLAAADIRMHDTLRVHEDTYFNRLSFEQTGNQAIINQPGFIGYLWCWNPNSTVRRDNGIYRYNSTIEHVTASTEPLAILKSKNLPVSHCVFDIAAYYYGVLQSSGHRGRPEEENAALEQHLAKCLQPYWQEARKSDAMKLLPQMQLNALMGNAPDVTPKETFDQFVHRIGLE